jgi:hypothetical protein
LSRRDAEAEVQGEREFQALGVELHDVRSIVTEAGSAGAVILTSGSAVIMEHDAAAATLVTSYLRANGVPVYRYEDDIPDHHLPDAGNAVVTEIDA